MKKLLTALLVCILCLTAASFALADDVPEGYPAIKIDPATGAPYDFGGATIYIYDYWSQGEGSDDRSSNPTEEEAALYAYRDWLDSTYNCHIVQKRDGDWGTQASQFQQFVAMPDGSYRIYIIAPDHVGGLINEGAAASWNNDLVDLTDGSWNQATVEAMTLGSNVYGVSKGHSEPRQLLYFNKRVLTEAGIDYNDIYDMQSNGTWNWSAFTSILQQVQRDTDDDGTTDVFGLTGSSEDFYRIAVFANGGTFFDSNENGQLTPTANSDQTLAALSWAKSAWNSYAMPQPDDASWDWYKNAWTEGHCAFYVYQAYGGFNDNSEMSGMEDPWGAVAFPLGPNGDTYVTIVSENTTVLPAVYDAETTAKLTFIYEMWTRPTPGYSDEDSWIGNKYNYTDERAVNETYAMLRENGHCVVDKVYLLGSVMNVESGPLLWYISESSPSELVENSMPNWQALCDEFNESQAPDSILFTCSHGELSFSGKGPMPDTREWAEFSEAATSIVITGRITSICDHAFENFVNLTSVTFGDYISDIGSYAFSGCESLESVSIPGTVKTLGSYAFSGCTNLSFAALSNGMNTVSSHAFAGCTGLERVRIPFAIHAIEEDAFAGCTDLTAVEYDGWDTLWAKVTIADGNDCIDQASLSFRISVTPLTLDERATANITREGEEVFFSFTPAVSGYYCFEATFWDAYKCLYDVNMVLLAADYNDSSILTSYLTAGEEYIFSTGYNYSGSTGDFGVILSLDPISWSVENGVLLITGSGAMRNYDGWRNLPPWSGHLQRIHTVIIDEGVQNIGNCAFCDSSLSSIQIPGTVTSIGYNALYNCDELASAVIPEGVQNISSSAFAECDSLSSITLPSTLSWMEYGVFENDAALSEVTVSSGETRRFLAYWGGCLRAIDLPVNLQRLNEHVFMNTQLGTVLASNPDFVLPGSLTTVESEAFAGASPVFVYVPETVSSIQSGAFASCTSLRYVLIDGYGQPLDDGAFGDLTGLILIGDYGVNEFASDYEGLEFVHNDDLEGGNG